MNSPQHGPSLRMLALIINHKDSKKAIALLEKHKAPMQLVFRGEGTASSEVLDYLGIGTTEKTIIFSAVLKDMVPELFDMLRRELHLYRPGHGIAITFPITGASMILLKLLSEEMKETIIKHIKKEVSQMTGFSHSLLMVTVKQGYSEEVMAAAREAGAGGGTVIHARRLGSEEAMKHWGITIQQENEIIFILAEQEKKLEIMQAIGNSCGISCQAHGFVVSIPVDAVTGLENIPADKEDTH